MRPSKSLGVAFAVSVCWTFAHAAKVELSSVIRESNLVSGAGYIIEVESSATIPTKRSPHEAVYHHLASRGVNFDVSKEFDTEDIFVGAALRLKDPSDVEKLREAPGITAIRPIVNIRRPQPKKLEVVHSPSDENVPADTLSTHRMTGVDKLHAEGHFGKGVSIGIIDSGIDYTHPTLGTNIGPGNLVVGGYDFVGDSYNGGNQPVEDDDPLDLCGGHGTHVAGIIAAQPDNDFKISGVVPEASLNAYRVFGCEGGVTDDIIVDALLRAYRDGNDVITLSLGGPNGWTEATSAVVASRIASRGRIVTIAAGNDGSSGAWFTSSPGNGLDVISVGSVNNIVIPVQTLTVENATVPHEPIPYYQALPLPIEGTRPVYATSTDPDVVDDACAPLPDSTPDLSPFVVIVRRGACTFAQKLDNIREKGATAALIYNNVAGFANVDFGPQHSNFPVSLILAEDGEYLVSEFASESAITLSFPRSGSSTYPNEDGGFMSAFSTYGPTNDMYFKPAVSAPGGNILSTYPTTLGSFAVLSGTSMATPFVAGVSALLLEIRGKSRHTALAARNLLQSTASPVLANPTEERLQTLTQQGAGLIQAYHALKTDITLSPTELLLNDTVHFSGTHRITIRNNGRRTRRFRVKHIPAQTAQTIQPGFILPNLGPIPLLGDAANVRLSQTSITLRPHSSKTITVRIQPPSGLDPSTLPVYSGFVEFSSRSETYRTSYVGVAASLKGQQIIDNSDYFFGVPIPTLLDASGGVQNGTMEYTLQGGDYPTVLWRAAFGSPHVRADLVDENIDFTPTYSRAGNARRQAEFVEEAQGSVKSVPIIGALSESFWTSRNDEDTQTGFPYSTLSLARGTFANGTTIPAGSFKILLRALKVTGNVADENDYESWLSPTFTVIPS